MSLSYVPVEVPLARGRDGRSSSLTLSRRAANGSLSYPVAHKRLENLVLDEHGVVKKRAGCTLMTTDIANESSARSSALAVLARGTELLTLEEEGDRALAYLPTLNAWAERGPCVGWGVDSTPVANFVANTDYAGPRVGAGCATVNGITVVAWYNHADTEVLYSVFDGDSPVVQNQVLSSADGGAPRVLPVGDEIFILWCEDNAPLHCKVIDTASLADLETSIAASPTDDSGTAEDTSYGKNWDAVSDGSQVIYAYRENGSSTQDIVVGYIGAGGVFGSTASLASATYKAGAGWMAVAANSDSSRIAILYYNVTDNRLSYIQVNDSLSVVNSGAAVTGTYVPGEVTALWRNDDSGFDVLHAQQLADAQSTQTDVLWYHCETDIYQGYVDAATGYGGSMTVVARNLALEGHLFWWRSKAYYLARDTHIGSFSTTSYYLVKLEDHKPAGVFLRSRGFTTFGGVESGGSEVYPVACLTRVQTRDTATAKQVEFALTEQFVADDYPSFTVHKIVLDRDSNDSHSRAQFNGNAYVAGPLLWEIGDTEAVEQGWLQTPQLAGDRLRESTWELNPTSADSYTNNAAVVLNGSGGLSAGLHTCYIVFESVGANGERVQSPGVTVNVLCGQVVGSTTITGFRLRVFTPSMTYRDGLVVVYRSEANGEVLYRMETANFPAANNYVDITIAAFSASKDVDTSAEQALVSVGEVENDAAHGVKNLVATAERLWGIDVYNPTRVYHSKLVGEFRATVFNVDYWVSFHEKVRALGFLGSTLLAFTAESVYAVAGEGPDNTAQGSFGPPVKIANNCGITNPRTLVETPVGWMWLSHNGFWMTGGGPPRFIGGPVQDLKDESFSRGVLVPGTSRVRWFISSTGDVAVDYDWELDAWMAHTTGAGRQAYDAVTVGSDLYHSVPSGAIYKRDTSVARDNNVALASVLETGELILDSAGAAKRFRRGILIGEDLSGDHTLTIEVAFDASGTFQTIGTYNTSGLPYLEFRIPDTGRYRSARFRITEVPGTGLGFKLATLVLEVAFSQQPGGFGVDQ